MSSLLFQNSVKLHSLFPLSLLSFRLEPTLRVLTFNRSSVPSPNLVLILKKLLVDLGLKPSEVIQIIEVWHSKLLSFFKFFLLNSVVPVPGVSPTANALKVLVDFI